MPQDHGRGYVDGYGDAGETIEERCFSSALICLEGHFTQSPPMGPQTALRVNSMITKTLEKTHTLRKSRCVTQRPPDQRKTTGLTCPQGSAVEECGHLDVVDQNICCCHT